MQLPSSWQATGTTKGASAPFLFGDSVKKILLIILLSVLFPVSAFAWTNTDSEPYYNNGSSPTYEQAVQKLRTEYQNKHPCTTRACRVTPKTSSNPSSNYFLVYLQSDAYGGPPSNCGTEWIGNWCDNNAPPPNNCQTDTISGGPVNGGWGTGIYDVNGCAYSCGTDYTKLDGQTSMYDAQSCSGTGQPYTTSEPSDYPEPPEPCLINSPTGCLDMDKQPNGSCPAGTTYGRVNNQDVCVPSGTPTDPLDEGSQGLPDSGGNQQAEGTPDKAGTGGSPTGSGTGNSTGGSSGTTTCTASPEGVETCTSTGTTQTETETTGPTTFGGHGDPASWWESNYPEGAPGIASKFSADIGNGPFMAMLDPLKSLPANGSEPTWSMDMQIGSMGSFGAVSLELPAGVWAFVRFAILFTTVMTVRKLIFGG